MTKQQKITLNASRDIPFDKLMLSQSNVCHVKAGVSIEELDEDIDPRTIVLKEVGVLYRTCLSPKQSSTKSAQVSTADYPQES